MRFKARVGQEMADLIYNGLWFSAHNLDLMSYVASTQRFVGGTVRVRMYKGSFTVTGRKSPHSLYSMALATYDKGDQFDHQAAVGFIQLFGLPLRTQAKLQLSGGAPEYLKRLTAQQGALGAADDEQPVPRQPDSTS
jgi:argininosuccinate synthase